MCADGLEHVCFRDLIPTFCRLVSPCLVLLPFSVEPEVSSACVSLRAQFSSESQSSWDRMVIAALSERQSAGIGADTASLNRLNIVTVTVMAWPKETSNPEAPCSVTWTQDSLGEGILCLT